MIVFSTFTTSSWLVLLLTVLQITSVSAQDLSTAATIATRHVRSSPSLTTFQSTSNTSSSAPQTYTIQVGLLDHKIRPDTTEAAIGDIIEFAFYPANHSIVRAEYGYPCIPYEMTGSDKQGFFAGFHPVDKVLDNPPKWSIRINDTEPVFFYCSAPGSCITYGMVGGINLNSSQSIDKQRTLAMDSSFMLNPGETFPAESPLTSGNRATLVLPSSSAQSTSSSTSMSAPANTSPHGLSTGAIFGIAIAAASALLLGALLFFCWGRTKSLREAIERKDGTVRRGTMSPNQMVQHTHSQHANIANQGSFQFPTHPALHPGSQSGSPEQGVYSHQHNASMDMPEYFTVPGRYAAKYSSPPATHSLYHPASGSPPPGSLGLNGHPLFQGTSTPAPGYWEPFTPAQDYEQERVPAEMEAITVTKMNLSDDNRNVDKVSKI